MRLRGEVGETGKMISNVIAVRETKRKNKKQVLRKN